MLIFVYGTLKKGFRAHLILQQTNAKYIGEEVLSKDYTMYNIGGMYPAVIRQGNSSIHGEVYEVDTLTDIDRYEGYPSLFYRELINTQYGEAWIYLLKKPYSYNKIINDGKWKYDY